MKDPTGHMPMHRWMMWWLMCLCLVRNTLALWLMAYLVWMPAVTWTIAGAEATVMQRLGCLPWGVRWVPQSSVVWLWGATTLEWSHHRWTHLRSTFDRGGPEWYGIRGSTLHQSRRSTQPEGKTQWSMIQWPPLYRFPTCGHARKHP